MKPNYYIFKAKSDLNYLTKVGYNFTTRTPYVITKINKLIDNNIIKKSSKIFMIGEGKGHLLNANYFN